MRRPLRIGAVVAIGFLVLLGAAVSCAVVMPGTSYRGAKVSPDSAQLEQRLRADVELFATEIGERNLGRRPEALEKAALALEERFTSLGYAVRRQEYAVGGMTARNLEVTRAGTQHPEEIVVIGAHYDSVIGTPGADDNASGTAALLELARVFSQSQPERTLRFVAFVNEEPPHFVTADMGSFVYAKECKAKGEDVVAMLSLETIGFFRDEKGSQQYPFPLSLAYPDTGNFMGFVSNIGSAGLLRRVLKTFRANAKVPSEGASLPASIPGVGWSDQWSFWQVGYPALMVTDTAPFRNPHYHQATDTPETLDYPRYAEVVRGLEFVVADLAGVKR